MEHIDLSETLSTTTQTVHVSPNGKVNIECPFCDFKKHVNLPQKLYNKSVRITCLCSEEYILLFCNRRHYRRDVDLIGKYWDTFGKERTVVIKDISHTGLSFDTGSTQPYAFVGDTIRVTFELRHKQWIDVLLVVIRMEGSRVGGAFYEPSDHVKKQIGFYLR